MRWARIALVAAGGVVSGTGCGRINFGSVDAGVDDAGERDADTDVGVTCPTTFCDGFDGEDVLDTWDDEIVVGAGSGTIVDGELVITIPADIADYFAVKTFPGVTSRFVLSFDLEYTAATPGEAEIDFIQVRWAAPPAPCTELWQAIVRDSTGPLSLQETYPGCGGNTTTAAGSYENTGSHSYVLAIELGAAGAGRVQLDVDGVREVDVIPAVEMPAGDLTVLFGAGAVRDVVSAYELRYDNVTVEVE